MPKHIIVVSIMNQQTGIYFNAMVSSMARWKVDRCNLHEGVLLNIEVFESGVLQTPVTYHSVEDFEESEINIRTNRRTVKPHEYSR